MTSTLHVLWTEGALAASADQAPILIGRSPDAAVHIADRSVSRAHLRVHAENGNWIAVDESSHGTYSADGQRLERLTVGPVETTLHLGSPEGPRVLLSAVPPTPPGPDDQARDTNAGAAPYVPPINVGEAWTVATSDTTLRLEVDGIKHAFTPPGRVVVGRDPACDVVCDNDLVSRQHLAFTAAATNWVMEDLGSSRGSYVDGKRLRKPSPARGAFVVTLGDEDAGERVQVVTAGVHRKPRDRSKWGVVALGVLLIGALISVGAAFALWPRDGGANSPEQITAAKESTVFLFGLTQQGEAGSGSGTFVSDDLILTNAHVADIETELGVPLLVAMSPEEDAPVEVSFVAREVARHPYLDLALLEVDRETPVEDLPVVEAYGITVSDATPRPMPLGDSAELVVGSRVASFGFPSQSSEVTTDAEGDLILPVASLSEGQITGLRPWPSCASAGSMEGAGLLTEHSSCSPDGALPRGNLLSDEFSAKGGSGGPVVVDGELVAVRYAGVGDLSEDPMGATGNLAASMPIEYFADWLDNEIAGD